MFKKLTLIVGSVAALFIGGCTAHPAGERAERDAANNAGRPFAQPFDVRPPTTLPSNPSADDLVRAALLSNAVVEQSYWRWRSAIEQIPQDGTQPGDVAIFGGLNFQHGSTSLDRVTLGAGNDPMNDIVLPAKLSTAARRALENAQAAGLRFRQAQFDVRKQVLDTWYDYALTAELIRLEKANAELLQTTALFAEATSRAGRNSQRDALKASNDVDLSRNEVARLESQLPIQRATLNALLGRATTRPIATPSHLPSTRPAVRSDDDWLSLAAKQNPELLALTRQLAGHHDEIKLAQLKYLPEFSISIDTDLKVITQSLAGMVTVPFFRREALDAAIAQAEADLRETEALRRQTANDLGARLVSDLLTLHDADREISLYEGTILPRARQTVVLSRSAYETSQTSLLDLIESQRSLIEIEKLVAQLRVARGERLVDLESIAAIDDGARQSN